MFAVVIVTPLLFVHRRSLPTKASIRSALPFVASSVFVDADHLLDWRGVYWARIIPLRFWELEGLVFKLREAFPIRAWPSLPLHYWLWPMLLLSAALILRKWHPTLCGILVAGAGGFSLHLLLDGMIQL